MFTLTGMWGTYRSRFDGFELLRRVVCEFYDSACLLCVNLVICLATMLCRKSHNDAVDSVYIKVCVRYVNSDLSCYKSYFCCV
jgi:hypothetical protein